MKIEEITYKICCDMPGCENLAKYSLFNTKSKGDACINMCADCVRQLYENIGAFLVPKSPKNILNNNTKKR